MTKILKALPVREKYVELLREQCEALNNAGIYPNLKVILVGNHPASLLYTKNKKKFCEKIGASCEIINLSETLSEEDFLSHVHKICDDTSVHGAFIQLPLPKHLAHIDVGNLIPTNKDVDGFSQENLYKLLHGDNGENSLLPCTPKGIITLLKENNIELSGKNVVVIGRSLIVGKPMALLLLNQNATVTICHSKTVNLQEKTRNADIIISAIGRPKFITSDFIGDNMPVLVDVGMNQDANGKLCGDIDFEDVLSKCSAITPVPGGVGPMTILSLIQNLIKAANWDRK